ncbi:MAG TPA: HAD-IA family hydrolase [Fimbriimonas sp.]|nr:HAD-IA family hydrolase [Fimbriimonas sp.]
MRFEVAGLLFDLDGTLVNSHSAVDRAWTAYARRHSLNPADVLQQIHGRRALDTIRLLTPNIDAEQEYEIVRQDERTDLKDVTPLAGAKEILRNLDPTLWAIVTSGTSDVAHARIAHCGLPEPKHVVYGEEVERGKPEPDEFLAGANKLGFRPEQCLVFEDTEPGVQAAKAAGMNVIGISAVSGREGLMGSDAVVNDFTAIAVTRRKTSLLVIAWP